VVQKEALAALADPELRAYVVWTPILDGDTAGAARRAAADLPADPRVTHYWDDGRALANSLGARLSLPGRGIAWDIYLVYPPRAAWPATDDAPPPPARWMSQLDDVPPAQAPQLDGPLLRRWLTEAAPQARGASRD